MLQKADGKIVVTRHDQQHYRTLFDRTSGFFLRAEEKGFPEPFWSEDGPELLDVSITNYCEHGCSFCYRQSSINGMHIALEDLKEIVRQSKEAGVLQMALGGGNPNQHPQFIEILRLIRESGIVPSYTSNGQGLTDDILKATKSYCGAMALSLYPPYDRYEGLTERVHSFGIKLNLHVILKRDTIATLTKWMQNPLTWFKNLNAVIVLNYKPVRSAKEEMVTDHTQLEAFYKAVSGCKSVKVGFDSCCVPGIVTWIDVNEALLESCEAARFSAFISEDMKMYPCSFMESTERYGDLRNNTLLDVWQHNKCFIEHREKITNNGCTGCKHLPICNGGCVFMPEINQCR